MDDFDVMIPFLLLTFFGGFLIGLGIATPKELDNGCLVDDGKIYCEKVEVSE